MESNLRPAATIVDVQTGVPQAGVSWAAVAAGAVTTAALALLLVAFGAGLGLSAISPWSDSGASASTFNIGTGIYLIIVGVMSSAVGGYLAGRLQTKWVNVHSNEVFFRDTAHGFLAWAFATLIGATALTSTSAYLANGAVAGIGGASSQAARSINPAEVYVDKLFRIAPGAQATPAPTNPSSTTDNTSPANSPIQSGFIANASNPNQSRAEVLRLWTAGVRGDEALNAGDKAYVAQLVAARTGMSQADAQKRVDQVVIEAKTVADNTRRNAADLSFWLTAALLFGAFAASLAAAEGGALRDGTWNERVLTPRAI
jgi:hypothetical protein